MINFSRSLLNFVQILDYLSQINDLIHFKNFTKNFKESYSLKYLKQLYNFLLQVLQIPYNHSAVRLIKLPLVNEK